MIKLDNLKPGTRTTFVVTACFTRFLNPSPPSITQEEKQFVVMEINLNALSDFMIELYELQGSLPRGEIRKYHRVDKGVQRQGSVIKYGPYNNIEPRRTVFTCALLICL